MIAIMMNGYFKGEEIDIATPVPEYKFVLPVRNDYIMPHELTFENLAKYKPSIAVYKRAIVTKSVVYYKFARYE